jgi:hypothetical protein
MPYSGGVGGPAARPIPFHSRLCLASTFICIRETWIRNFFKKMLAILGTFGGFPP